MKLFTDLFNAYVACGHELHDDQVKVYHMRQQLAQLESGTTDVIDGEVADTLIEIHTSIQQYDAQVQERTRKMEGLGQELVVLLDTYFPGKKLTADYRKDRNAKRIPVLVHIVQGSNARELMIEPIS